MKLLLYYGNKFTFNRLYPQKEFTIFCNINSDRKNRSEKYIILRIREFC